MRVLVVEDEKSLAAFLKSSLEENCFSVDLAFDGDRGSFLARTNDYDLIILDNVLPLKSGFEVCRDVRGRGRTVPILVLSVKTSTSLKIEMLNSGVDDYMTKPFSLEELLARTQALLRRPQEIESDILQIDDLVLDTVKYTVVRGKQSIYLTRKEFMLLSYLLRNRGNVVSRGMILEHVWDMDGDPFSNTIESHISSLRRKIDRSRGNKIIHTVPGRGYKADTLKI